jgi:MFS family permease
MLILLFAKFLTQLIDTDTARKSEYPIFPILTVNFIGTLGYSIILPFLIVLVMKFGGNELIYGALGATYSFFQLIGAPILGKWSDRIGRRRILLLSQAGTFIAWVIFLVALLIPNAELFNMNYAITGAFVLTIPMALLFFSRALDGLTGGNVSVANAYLADITPEKDRNKNYGKMSVSANLGFILGPALAGLLGNTSLGEVLPVVMAMLISFIAIFVIYRNLKDVSPCSLHGSADQQKTRKILGIEIKECHPMLGEDESTFKGIVQIRGMSLLLILYFLTFLAFNFFYVAFPIYAVDLLQWNIFQLGVFFSIMAGIMVLIQGPVLSKLSKIYTDELLILVGSILLGFSFFLFRSSGSVAIYGAVILFATGNGIMWPSFLSVLSRHAGKMQGAVQGLASSAGSLASIAGLLLGAVLYGIYKADTFLIPCILMFIIALSTSRLFQLKSGKEDSIKEQLKSGKEDSIKELGKVPLEHLEK